MTKRRLTLLIAWAVLVAQAGKMLVTAHAQTPVNMLNNPGLEPHPGCPYWHGISELQVAPGWTPWWFAGSPEQISQGELFRPEYRCLSGEQFGAYYVHQGGHSQKLFTRFATHEAGLYQQLMVPPGSTVTFTAWSLAWSSNGDSPYHSTDGRYYTQVGIDPAGGADPEGGEIVWSDTRDTMDTWLEHQVEAVTEDGFITVWLRGRTQWGLSHNDAYWDDASLTVMEHPLQRTALLSPEPTATVLLPEPSRSPPSEEDIPLTSPGRAARAARAAREATATITPNPTTTTPLPSSTPMISAPSLTPTARPTEPPAATRSGTRGNTNAVEFLPTSVQTQQDEETSTPALRWHEAVAFVVVLVALLIGSLSLLRSGWQYD